MAPPKEAIRASPTLAMLQAGTGRDGSSINVRARM